MFVEFSWQLIISNGLCNDAMIQHMYSCTVFVSTMQVLTF